MKKKKICILLPDILYSNLIGKEHNIYIHGVTDQRIRILGGYPQAKFDYYKNIGTKWQSIENFYAFQWSGNLNFYDREYYAKIFYRKLNQKIDTQEIKEGDIINLYGHSHGGNLLFSNGDIKNNKEFKKFLNYVQKKNIIVNIILFETPVIPTTEKLIEKILIEYDNINIKQYVAAADYTQIKDITSNFPFTNRFYNFTKEYMHFKQYSIKDKTHTITHSNWDNFMNIISGNYDTDNITIVKVTHTNNRSVINKLFFEYGYLIPLIIFSLFIFIKINKENQYKKLK